MADVFVSLTSPPSAVRNACRIDEVFKTCATDGITQVFLAPVSNNVQHSCPSTLIFCLIRPMLGVIVVPGRTLVKRHQEAKILLRNAEPLAAPIAFNYLTISNWILL